MAFSPRMLGHWTALSGWRNGLLGNSLGVTYHSRLNSWVRVSDQALPLKETLLLTMALLLFGSEADVIWHTSAWCGCVLEHDWTRRIEKRPCGCCCCYSAAANMAEDDSEWVLESIVGYLGSPEWVIPVTDFMENKCTGKTMIRQQLHRNVSLWSGAVFS